MTRSNHTQGTFGRSWRVAGPLSVAFVLGATLGLSQVAGAGASAPGVHGASGAGGHPGLIYTNRVVGNPQHFPPGPTGLQAARGRSKPAITSQPVSVSVTTGSPASFSAAASGSPTPTVQWQVSVNSGSTWSNITGASSTTYSQSTTTTSENGYRYRAVFTNSAGTARTNAATLTVTAPVTAAPAITSQPVSVNVTAGSPAPFSAAASGSPTPTVQWQVSINSGSTWSNITGASSTTYSQSTTTTSENGYEYEAVFTNSAGSATTNPATLTVTAPVTEPPAISQQPVSETVPAGSTASFSASASGTPTPTVQWQVSTNAGTSWSNAAGATATSTTYSFTASTSENGDEYEAIFTNSAGSATTNPATLTVTSAPEQSSNWSGYADTGSGFSAVSASWTVPTVSCPSGNSYSAHWIGIDGATSSTVEQDGTEADCSGRSGVYDAWYEMYGDSAVNNGYEVELSPSSYPVSPGDAISASVSVVSGTWTLAISDAGSTSHPRSWNFTTNVAFSGGAQSSAEWIVERPEICNIFSCSLATLANFWTVTFTNASATANGTTGSISNSNWSDAAIEMVDGSTPIAVPGSLDPTGKVFTDTYG